MLAVSETCSFASCCSERCDYFYQPLTNSGVFSRPSIDSDSSTDSNPSKGRMIWRKIAQLCLSLGTPETRRFFQLPSSTVDPTKNTTTFHRFRELPEKLQRLIFNFAFNLTCFDTDNLLVPNEMLRAAGYSGECDAMVMLRRKYYVNDPSAF